MAEAARTLSPEEQSSLQQFAAIHYTPTDGRGRSFDGRVVIGSRRRGSDAPYIVATRRPSELGPELSALRYIPNDYYLTANAITGGQRIREHLFALHNVVVDVDCHADDVTAAQRGHAIDELAALIKARAPELPNTVVKTGRGLQLWWAIVPISARLLWAYEAKRATLAAQISGLISTRPDLLQIFGSVDMAATNNPVGFYRLPGSYNTKTGRRGSFEILHSGRLDVLQEARAQAAADKEARSLTQRDRRRVISYDAARLAVDRERKISRLVELRSAAGQTIGRDLAIFAVYNSACPAYDEAGRMAAVCRLNDAFTRPMDARELSRILSSSRKRDGYHVTNRWIIEALGVTEDEQRAIGLYTRGDARGSGREEQRSAARAEKQARNERIAELYLDGRTYAQIAEETGASVATVGRVIRSTTKPARIQIEQQLADLAETMDARQISELTGWPVSTVYDRLRALGAGAGETTHEAEESSSSEKQAPGAGPAEGCRLIDFRSAAGRITESVKNAAIVSCYSPSGPRPSLVDIPGEISGSQIGLVVLPSGRTSLGSLPDLTDRPAEVNRSKALQNIVKPCKT